MLSRSRTLHRGTEQTFTASQTTVQVTFWYYQWCWRNITLINYIISIMLNKVVFHEAVQWGHMYGTCTAPVTYMCFLFCITSCQNQLNLVWVRNNLRKTLFRGRWYGGKSLERRGEGFVSILRTEVVFQAERRGLTLHCGFTASSHWGTCSEMTGEDFLNISNIPLYMLPLHLYVWPFVDLVVWMW